MTSEPALVELLAEQLINHDLRGPRAAELAIEVSQLRNAVLQAAHALQFDDDPAAFTTLLEGSDH
jgi:hypothetical protein